MKRKYVISQKQFRQLNDLLCTLEAMDRPGLWFDEPTNPDYVPIQMKESDLGLFHLPIFRKIMSNE